MISALECKEQVIESIALNEYQKEFMNLMFRSFDDLQTFVSKYEEKIECGKIMLALLDHREKMIAKAAITLPKFIKSYCKDKKGTLEQLFIMPIDSYIIETLDRIIYNEELTLETLYLRHVEQPNCNILLLMN